MLNLFYQSTYPGGNAVTNLTQGDPSFPGSPDVALVQTNGLQDFQDLGAAAFGTWSRGFLEAPQTGQYTFWIASDDDGQFWLSTDATTNNQVMICQNVGAVGYGDYTARPMQQSASISLVAGQKYYYAMYHAQGGGAEHCEVSWQLPDETTEAVISGNHLWAFPEADLTGAPQPTAPGILSQYQGYDVPVLASSSSVLQGRPLDLVITAEASQPAYVQWYSNNVVIPGANLLAYHIPVAGMNQDGASYSVIVSNNLGTASASTTLSVTPDTTPPTLVDALNLGNPGGDIAVIFSEGVDPVTGTNPANYSIPGATVTGARIGSTPDTVLLQVTGLTVGTAHTVTVNHVEDLAGNAIAAASSITLEEDLAAWYRLDESSGTVASDASGNGLNGTMMNDVIPGYAGKVFRSLRFLNSAAPGYVKLPAGFSNFKTNGMTVALWAYPTSEGAQATWDRFIDFGNGPANDNILFARNGTGQSVNFSAFVGGAGAGVSTPDGTLFMNQWQHFTATMDPSGNVILYRNGVEVASGNIPPPNAVTRANNYLGLSNWAGDDHYDGRMDDVRIYDRVLSPAAIRTLANGGGSGDSNPAIPNVSVVATTPNTTLQGGSPGVFTITRAGETSAGLTVDYSVSGTATNGDNYAALSGSAVIPAGTNSVQVLVTPIDYSFSDVSRTVILAITPAASYSLEDPNSGTVTIQNNDLSPTATVAAGDNPGGAATGTTIDVWFAASVTDPTATTLANYMLNNAPGLTLTNATLQNSGFRVVLGVSGPLPTNASLSVSGVEDGSGHSAPVEIPVYLRQAAVNVVANTYHQGRPNAFAWSTDLNSATYWDTWNGGDHGTDFVGLLYPFSEDIHSIKVVLGNQYSDGGDWSSQPKVYILKHPVDVNQTRPETDPGDWLQVPAKLVSPNQFQPSIDPNARNTPIVFDLSDVPDSDRTGYGWAVGGVPGAGGASFITIADVSGYATQGANNTMVVVQEPANLTVTAGQVATITEQITNGIAPLTYQWQRSDDGGANFNNISGGNDVYYSLNPALPSDNNAQFRVIVSTVPPVNVVTSTAAILTVLNRTTPPVVLDATYDPTNLLIDVWFDEPVDSGSASSGSYSINDGAVSLSVNNVDARARRVVLSASSAPTVVNPTITVNNIQDTFGNTLVSAQTVPLLDLSGPAAQVVANQYQQGRPAAFLRSTDGLVQHDNNVTTWTTYGGTPGTSDFAGLTYAQPQAFGVIQVDLGYQFVNGGDWGYQPKVFILKNPVDSNQTAPENDPSDWVEVPASLISGNVFTAVAADAPADTVPPPNTPIAFDLSQLPLSQRVGYGWAVGGVPGNALVDGQFVSIAELRSFGMAADSLTNGAGAPQLVLDVSPLDQSLPAGSRLTYTAIASGSEPLSYQWYFNGTALSDTARLTGAHSSTLEFASTQFSDAGGYYLVATNSSGAVTSSVANLHLTGIAFNDGGGWTGNGNGAIAANALTLTHGNTGETSSGFLNFPMDISAFTATWTYQDIGGGGADGTVFVLQNDPRGPSAIGGGGGQLGYAGTGAIIPAAGLEFNIYGPNTPGIVLDTSTIAGPPPFWSTAPVNVASGDPIGVWLQYDGTVLSLELTNTITGNSFRTNWDIDLPAAVGGTNTAYIGFTGASGGIASHQVVSDFTFTSGLAVSLSIKTTAAHTVLISWPNSSAGFVLQESAGLSSANWLNVTNDVDVVGGQNQVEILPTAGTEFYRLSMP